MTDLVDSDLGHGVRELHMKDPEGENLLTEASTADLISSLGRLGADPELKVLVLTGEQEVFSGGASLEELRRLAAGETDLNEWTLPAALIEFPVPIVAAVEGHAVGGGLMLALCCDIAVASASSRYGLNFTALGFTPGMGTTRLIPALVGHGLAMEMILTGKYYKGEELAGAGLFNSVVAADRVRDTARTIADRIAERPRHVIEMIKRSLSEARMNALRDAIAHEPAMQKTCFTHPDTLSIIEEMYLK